MQPNPRTSSRFVLPFFVLIIAVVAISLAVLVRTRIDFEGRMQPSVPPPAAPVEPPSLPFPAPELSPDEVACSAAGGHWNPCGSACRGAPSSTVCIQVCVPQCECGGIAGFRCPERFACTDLAPIGAADALGICTRAE